MTTDGRLAGLLDELATAADEVAGRVPAARHALDELAADHDEAAMTSLTPVVPEVEQLIDSARELIASGRTHLGRGDEASAAAAARGSEAALQRARDRLEEAHGARERLASAEEDLREALNSIHEDLRDVRRLRADDEVTTSALARAEPVIADATAALLHGGDRLTALDELSRAEQDLDAALTEAREAAEQRKVAAVRLERRVRNADALVADLDRQLSRCPRGSTPELATEVAKARHQVERARALLTRDPTATSSHLDVAMRHTRYVQACLDDAVFDEGTLGPPASRASSYHRRGPGLLDFVLDKLLGGSSGHGGGGRF